MKVFKNQKIYLVLEPSKTSVLEDILVIIDSPRQLYHFIKGSLTNDIDSIQTSYEEARELAQFKLDSVAIEIEDEKGT